MIASSAIRTAIKELLEGTIGSVRTLKTTEYITIDPNNFSAWTPILATVTSNTAYGPAGLYDADTLGIGASGLLGTNITVPNSTAVIFSVYAWVATGTKNFRIGIVKKMEILVTVPRRPQQR